MKLTNLKFYFSIGTFPAGSKFWSNVLTESANKNISAACGVSFKKDAVTTKSLQKAVYVNENNRNSIP